MSMALHTNKYYKIYLYISTKVKTDFTLKVGLLEQKNEITVLCLEYHDSSSVRAIKIEINLAGRKQYKPRGENMIKLYSFLLGLRSYLYKCNIYA